jgi:hypothetical protein
MLPMRRSCVRVALVCVRDTGEVAFAAIIRDSALCAEDLNLVVWREPGDERIAFVMRRSGRVRASANRGDEDRGGAFGGWVREQERGTLSLSRARTARSSCVLSLSKREIYY